MVDGNYWPFALWFTVCIVKNFTGLNHLEVFFRKKENWSLFIKEISASRGFINIQFGGLEMERNKNWNN